MEDECWRLPPGPAGDFHSSEELLPWMALQFPKFGDIFKASIFGCAAYVTRDPGHAQHVLIGNPQNYVKGQLIKRVALLLGSGLMASEGGLWKRQRRMIQPGFQRHAIAPLAAPMTAANLALLEKWQAAAARKQTVNLTRDVSQAVLAAVLMAIFGEDHDAVAPHFAVLSEDPRRSIAFAQTFRGLGKIVLGVLGRRRRRGAAASDILGMLIEARDRDTGEPMPERQILNEVMTLIVAGHETTAGTLAWVWHSLALHPAAEQRLADELAALPAASAPAIENLARCGYARQVIEETLRLYPPGWLVTRRALGNDHLGQYFVPAGTEIYIPPYFIQRHPGLWPDPERFDPDRFAPERAVDRPRLAMLPFSVGPRNCIGEHFARLEMQLHLTIIARHLRLRLVAPQPVEFDAGVNLRSRHDFIMAPEFRDAAPPAMR